MAANHQGQSSQTLKQMADRILTIGYLSRFEYLQLVTTFLSDYKVTDDERSQINRIFDQLQTDRMKIVN